MLSPVNRHALESILRLVRCFQEQLTALPAAFRIVGGPELRDAVRVLGQRLLAAAGEEPSPAER